MAILVKTGEVKFIPHGWGYIYHYQSPSFISHVLHFIPLNLNRVMNGIPLTMMCILVNNYDNWSSLLMIQSTKASNENWHNVIIMNSFNFYMPMWVLIDYSNILIINPSISTLVNQLLKMCAAMGVHIYKCGVNMTIYIPTNSDLFHPLCRIWIGVREYLSYIYRRNPVLLGKVGEYHRIIIINIIIMFLNLDHFWMVH